MTIRRSLPLLALSGSLLAGCSQGSRIDSLSIDSDAGLIPGSTIQVVVRGTPGAGGAEVMLAPGTSAQLSEVQPGLYQGEIVLGRDDRIDPSAPMVASLGFDRPPTKAFPYPKSFHQAAQIAAAEERAGRPQVAVRDWHAPD